MGYDRDERGQRNPPFLEWVLRGLGSVGVVGVEGIGGTIGGMFRLCPRVRVEVEEGWIWALNVVED